MSDTIASVTEQLNTIKVKETNVLKELEAIRSNIKKTQARIAGVKTIEDEGRRTMLTARFEVDLKNQREHLKLTEEKLGRVQNARWWAQRTLDTLVLAENSLPNGTLKHSPFAKLATMR